MNQIFKNKVQQDFSKVADKYEKYAFLQRKVATNMYDFCKSHIKDNAIILDAGCGTGFFSKLHSGNVIQCDIAYDMCQEAVKLGSAVNCDVEQLPFQDGSFDLVFSSLVYQWLENLQASFTQISQILKDDGVFAFSILTNGSLKELKYANKQLDKSSLRINDFVVCEDIESILEISGLEIIRLEQKYEMQYFNDVVSLLKNIKNIGANYKGNQENSFIGKKFLYDLNNIYKDNFSETNGIPVSWNLAYIICKPA